jgi:hypothetical protein
LTSQPLQRRRREAELRNELPFPLNEESEEERDCDAPMAGSSPLGWNNPETY